MGKRREPRKAIEVQVRIFGTDSDGKIFSENVRTLDVSHSGVLLGGVNPPRAAAPTATSATAPQGPSTQSSTASPAARIRRASPIQCAPLASMIICVGPGSPCSCPCT